MKITIKEPENNRKYPYLAVWTGGEPIKDYISSDVVVVSLQDQVVGDKIVFVQFLDAQKQGWSTEKETDFTPLPAGTIITLTQN